MKRAAWFFSLSGFLALVFALAAQQAPAPVQKAIGLDDILAWQGISGTALSEDGAWFAYRQIGDVGDGSAIFRETRGARRYTFNLGEEPEPAGRGGAAAPAPAPAAGGRGGGAVQIALSADAHFGAFLANPTHAEQEALRRQRRPVETHAVVVSLAGGEPTTLDRVRRFAFAGEENPDWIALQKLPPAAPAAAAGGAPAAGRGGRGGGAAAGAAAEAASTLILRNLATGEEFNIGNVGEFAFDRHGRYLAWTVSAEDETGNGIQLRDLKTGAVRSLDSDDHAVYSGLAWNTAGNALTALKGVDDKAWADKLYSVLGFTQLDQPAPVKTVFNPATAANFPANMSVSPNRNPAWSDDLAALTFGIHALKPAAPAAGGRGASAAAAADDSAAADTANSTVDLVIWNYQDPRLQSQQIVEENTDRNFNYLAEYRVAEKRFVRLADETVRDVALAPGDHYALGRDSQPYELDGHLDGQKYTDVYVIDMQTGARTLALKKARWPAEASPDGLHFAYYTDGNYWVYDMAAGKGTNLTASVPTSFVDKEDDHNLDRPPVAFVGWSRDSHDLLLSDNWDLWKVPIAGGGAVNLTVDGKRAQIRYRRPVNLDAPYDPDARGFDLTAPLYVDAYGEWTKQDGFAVVQPGQPGAARIGFDQASYGGLVKARHAAVYLYTRQTEQAPPDFYAAGAGLNDGAKITDLAAQQAGFLWTPGTILVDYTGYKGDRLQGALHLPAGYQKGKQYPMIVEFYEKMSQNAFQYTRPTANGFSISYYNSNGYAVLDPDITYKLDDPGISAAGCLEAAVKAAIATGAVDAQHVGIHGHSWGGYQTAFTITQTHLFAAAAAGAPLTDMISMYDIIYKNSGVTNGEIFEASQGRFTTPPWDNWAAYTRNSPVANVKNVQTPLLMLSDLGDGAVDFTQGIEYYDALRRLHKPVVLLDYPSQNHSLAKRADQEDYTVRMKQFFDHYLMGAPMPEWYSKGVAAADMQDYLRTFNKPAAASAAPPAAAGKGGQPR